MAITGLRGAPGGRHTASPKGLLCINPELRFIGPLSQDQDALPIARDFGYVWSQNWTYTWYANYCCSGTTYDECVFWLLDQGPTSLAKFVRLQQGVPAVKCIVIVVGTKTKILTGYDPCITEGPMRTSYANCPPSDTVMKPSGHFFQRLTNF